jgi:1-acyl-sn-glycerol-3-phosphate acyltransferase
MRLTNNLNLPVLGDQVPKRNRPVLRFIGILVMRLLGWRFTDHPMPNVPKVVALGGPHTSAWDIIVAMAAIAAIGIDLRVMGKHTMFWWPLRVLLRWVGLIPVNRQSPAGVVEQMAERFHSQPNLFLGIAPEGTRKKVTRWKTGFHRIAKAAGVPILPITLDFRHKQIQIGELLMAGDDMEADMVVLQTYFNQADGRNPELGKVVPGNNGGNDRPQNGER